MIKKVCIDTSIFFKLIIDEEDSDEVEELYSTIIKSDYLIISPEYLKIEIYSILLKKLALKRLNLNIINNAIKIFNQLSIDYIDNNELLEDSFELGKKLNMAAIYDCLFLDLAIKEDIPLITADQKFINNSKRIYKKIYNIKDALNIIS